MDSITSLLHELRVLPVLTVDSPEQAVDTVRALQAGGLRAVEVTLRTPQALQAIREVKNQFADFIVGVGTIKTPADVEAASAAGADFGVSPGLSEAMIIAAEGAGLPFLPGVATPTEVLDGMSMGLSCFKLFPAEAVGGLALLKSLAAPFEGVTFCPTGGISAENMETYLALPNVVCVGGSWMVSRNLLEQKRWGEVERLARACLAGRIC